jgi:hypothetical protein
MERDGIEWEGKRKGESIGEREPWKGNWRGTRNQGIGRRSGRWWGEEGE